MLALNADILVLHEAPAPPRIASTLKWWTI